MTDSAAPPANKDAGVATSNSATPRDVKISAASKATSNSAVSSSPLAFASPLSSRDSSPARPSQRQRVASALPPNPRKHSQDVSPHRPPSLPGVATTVPSAAAIQRALSATTTPQLQPSILSEPASKLPRARAAAAAASSGDEAPPQGTSSPGIRSPPATSGSRRNSLQSPNKKSDAPSAAPSIVVLSSTPSSSTTDLLTTDNGPVATLEDIIGPQSRQPLRERGASGAPVLATVEEGSIPSTPSTEKDESETLSKQTTMEPEPPRQNGAPTTADGSDNSAPDNSSSSRRKDSDAERVSRAKVLHPQSSYTSLASIKPKSAVEPTSRMMTVETETVSSAAQSALGIGDRTASAKNDTSGSLRLKPSTETIRPKKERKKPRKAPSINSGTASSKADIFEAKVASAVDDVNSSDSDETFVYESNPAESQPRRSRHHSRTPSATSMTGMGDPRAGLRSLATVMNSDRGVSGKRSMKFANNPYSSSGADDESIDRADGTLRGGTVRPSGGSGIHHHHMGRHNRGGMAPTSVFDEDGSPFTQASKRSGAAGSRQSSRPSSPRFGNRAANGNGTTRKNEVFGSYDLDADGADDERTPLMGTVRTPRSGRTSRVPASARLRHMERAEHTRGYWIKRFIGCAVMTIVVAAVVLGAVGFFFITTKPLYEVDVKEIRNVLASEQEIMLDLMVEAINPNLMTISISDMDVNVFAKSKHVGSEKWWRDHGKPPPPLDKTGRRQRALKTRDWFWPDPDDGDDNYDPPGTEGDQHMLLLGRVLHFDNALTFEGSPIKQHQHYSVGELRVPHPANKTEAGGTERWELVLQHPFQLIVRGILKYNLPLSTHVIAAPIEASVMVHPEKGVDDKGRMVIGRTKHTPYPHDAHSPLISHEGVLQDTEQVRDDKENKKIPRERSPFRSAKFREAIA